MGKEVLHTLATTYEVLNPIQGFTPGSPSRALGYVATTRTESSSDEDDEDDHNKGGGSRQLVAWRKEAKLYVEDRVGPGKREPYQKFAKDPTLDRIRKDVRLNHLPQSESVTVDYSS